MAAEKDNVPLSDTEAAERPVREQLKKASIAGMPGDAEVPTENTGASGDDSAPVNLRKHTQILRSRSPAKRSSDELDRDLPDHRVGSDDRHHRRKRSRGNQEEEEELNNGQRKVSGEKPGSGVDHVVGEENDALKPLPKVRPTTPDASGELRAEAAAETVASPKIKRSRLHSSSVEENGTVLNEQPVTDVDVPPAGIGKTSDQEDNASSTNTTQTKIPPTSGFANTSSTSPFGALAGSRSPSSEPPQTSSSAFAASGFSSLAGSSTSGFGGLSKSSGGFGSGGGFGTGSKSTPSAAPAQENNKPAESSTSTFGGSLGQKSVFAAAPAPSSGFGSGTSGFGTLGAPSGGFGSGLGGSGFGSLGGGGLSSFASGKPSTALASGSKSPRPFGAIADDDNDAEEAGEEPDESGFRSPLSQESDKQDERFYAQELETGEEDESVEYSARAKLYNYAAVPDGKKEWRERGLGILRLNVRKAAMDGEGEQKPRARFLMRADGSHRVLLNTPVKKEIKFGAPTGGAPQGGYMYFMGTIDGKTGLELLQLKVCGLCPFQVRGGFAD